MKSRYYAGVLAVMTMTSPAMADSLSLYGVWGEGSQLKKSQQQPSQFSLKPSPQKLGLTALALKPSKPKTPPKPVELAEGGAQPPIAGKAPAIVPLDVEYAPGEIVIDTSGRTLYFMVSTKQAYAYPIAVGKPGFTWTGTEAVSKIVDWPEWMPPDEMRERRPELPLKMTGGINNPLGAKAIYLGTTLYRIHGTNAGDSIGTAASSGCFRMHNAHVVHLASLVNTGTVVHVLKSLPKSAKFKNVKVNGQAI